MSTTGSKYRLVTRSDFDGLVCALLLRKLDLIDDIKFVHPKDVQDGKVPLSGRDITTNLPYDPNVHLAFDHHESETVRQGAAAQPSNFIIEAAAPSAARVVYNYYGGKERFPNVSEEMLAAVDKADSAKFTRQDVLHPERWVLLSFIMDPRTGLGRFHEFRVSNYQLMMDLIGHCENHSIGEILALPDVKERVDLYVAHEAKFKDQLQRLGKVHGPLVVLDLRQEDPIYAGNRFVIYALFPECSISMHVMWGVKKQNTVFAIGKSIFNRTSPVNVGELCLTYGGGGHSGAGTCQSENDKADQVMTELIRKITAA